MSIPRKFKSLVRRFFRRLGYRLEKINSSAGVANSVEEEDAPAGDWNWEARPVGHFEEFFEDIKKRGFTPAGVVDVGADVGTWSEILWKVYGPLPTAFVEPRKLAIEGLSGVAERSPGSKIFHCAAGACDEEKHLTVLGGVGTGASLLSPEGSNSAGKEDHGGTVSVRSLDSILAEMPSGFIPSIVKLDIQGFELEALKGAGNLIEKAEIIIPEVSFFEFRPGWPLLSEVVSFMQERGFEAYDFPGFLRRPTDGALGQVDIAFVQRDGWFRSSNRW